MHIDEKEANKIGNQLHIIRVASRFTRKELGRIIGITDKSIRWLERGMMKSRTTNLIKLVEYYNSIREDLDEDSLMRLNHICKTLNLEPI